MAHPFQKHSEHSKSHIRVHHILKGGGHKSGGAAHADAAADRKLFRHMIGQHEKRVHGAKKPGRFARGGKTKGKDKGGNHTHIAVVVPQSKGPQGLPPPPMPMPPPPPPHMMGPPPGGLPGGPPGVPPPGLPPGGPGGPGGPPPRPPGVMKRGGRIKKADGGGTSQPDGDAADVSITKWSDRASKNSYARGGSLPTAGALSGEGRLQKAHMRKRK